ncbi:hypothetical protein [Acinetobacter sp. B51(2017)]|uniref:hypothetical protein n=1 Tax=Acinetobacter sp. B51(2017) TaxID=2060938 RepID=UPI000F08899A|nr:hypothetical protein [Acinetobacter sp. B51(2017)]
MNKQLNISVFGLKLTTIDELKRIIEGLLPEHYNVNWTNINDASLDILLISHLFYDLPNIVSIRQRPNLKTLKIAHDPLLQGQLVQDTFYLPVESNGIRLWFEQHVLEVTQPSNPLTTLNNLNSKLQPEPKPQGTQIDNLFKQLDIQKTIPALNNQPIVANTAVNATTISASQTVKPVKQPSYQEQIKRASQQIIEPRFVRAKSALQGALFYEAIHYKHFENLQHKLWQSTDYRQCILIAGDTKIALIDKPHNQFWLANGLTTVGQSSIHLQHADLNNVVRFCHKNQPYDLQYGLWNFVWQNVGAIVPSYTGYYRLKYWPQPLQHQDQKDIFKIAAYLQHGAHLHYVHEHSGISLEFIYRFIFTGLVSNSIEEINEQQADPRFKSIQTTNSVAEPTSALRNFFGKLRKKLGL